MQEEEEIIKAIESSIEIHRLGGVKIVQIDEKTIIKYGKSVKIEESDAINFVDKKTNIPVPKIKKAFIRNDITYMAMSKISGKPLSELWPILRDTQKDSIILKLKEYIKELREIENPLPYNYIGNLNKNGCFDVRRYERVGDPFKNEEEFNNFMISGIEVKIRISSMHSRIFDELMITKKQS